MPETFKIVNKIFRLTNIGTEDEVNIDLDVEYQLSDGVQTRVEFGKFVHVEETPPTGADLQDQEGEILTSVNNT